MKRYPIRAVKYMVQLCILFFVMFGLLQAFGYGNVTLSEMFDSSRGYILLAAVIFFALLYPFFGFTKKTLTFDASTNEAEVERVMGMCGYQRVEGEAQAMVFRAATMPKKIVLMWEDTIEINTVDGLSTMEGARKEVVKASFRMGTFIN